MKYFATIIALLLSSTVCFAQELTQDEKSWIAAIQPFFLEAKAANINAAVGLDHESESGTSPVAMIYRPKEQQCLFMLAAKDSYASDVLQGVMPTSEGKEVARAATAAHEYGHCVHNVLVASKAPGSEALPPPGTPQAERLADVFALAWFAKNRPADFASAHKFWTQLRKGVGNSASHNTLKAITASKSLNDDMARNPASPMDYAMNIVLNVPLPKPIAPEQVAMAQNSSK